MDILYSAICYPPRIGGGELHLHMVAKGMQALGHTAHVINQWSRWRRDWLWGTTVLSDPPQDYVYEEIPVSRIGFDRATRLKMLPWVMAYPGLMGASIREIARLFGPVYQEAAGRPDLVHAVRMGREFLLQTALEFSRRQGIPIVLTPVHHPRWKGFFYRHYDRLYREMDGLIALTEYEKEMLVAEKGVKPERVFVTGIGPVLGEDYSVEEFWAQYQIRNPYVLFLGRHVAHKGFAALLRATRAIWRRCKDVDFVFIGPRTAASDQLFPCYADPRIHYLGQVDLRTKTSALAGCQLFCLPSLQESFGGVYCEAWAFQKPVIGGNIPSIACVIQDQTDGLLSDQDPERLAEKVLYLLDHEADARQMGQNGYAKVQRQYTWPQITAKTLAAYQAVLQQGDAERLARWEPRLEALAGMTTGANP